MIKFTIPGKPFAKQRARASNKNGKTRMYTPTETVNYETLVQMYFKQAYPNFRGLYERAIYLEVIAYFPILKSTPKKLLEAMESEKFRHIKKPDFDNVAKIISDALNFVVFKDDCQVSDTVIRKRYSKNPRVEVSIWEVDNVDF